jgi:hypothetical protein
MGHIFRQEGWPLAIPHSPGSPNEGVSDIEEDTKALYSGPK